MYMYKDLYTANIHTFPQTVLSKLHYQPSSRLGAFLCLLLWLLYIYRLSSVCGCHQTVLHVHVYKYRHIHTTVYTMYMYMLYAYNMYSSDQKKFT